MKKKRFYNNKKRDTKWTEPVRGHKIYFADKYIDDGTGSDKYDNSRRKEKRRVSIRERWRKFCKFAIVFVFCFAVISIGYTAMDVYIDRRAMPSETDSDTKIGVNDVSLNIKSESIDPLSLDGSTLLTQLIEDADTRGYTSVTFDLKRDDGTIGYKSQLANVDIFAAESSPSTALHQSVKLLQDNDILPIGRISCYKDNVATRSDLTASVMQNGKLYHDNDGNAYLNPDSNITYEYIKSIVEEVKNMGVSVIVLDNYDLPAQVSSDYNDGYAVLVKKLQASFGEQVKFLKAVSVNISSDENSKIASEWQKQTESDIASDVVFFVNAKDVTATKTFLDTLSGINYVIVQ